MVSFGELLILSKRPDTLPIVMHTLLGLAKTMPSPLTVVPLLGISVDVTLRLKDVKDEKLKQIDPALKVGSHTWPGVRVSNMV